MDLLAFVLRTALALAVVLGVLWAAHRVATRAGRGRRSGPVPVTVVTRQALTQRAAVALVDVGERRYLLGVADGGVSLLDSMPRPAADFAAALAAAEGAAGTEPAAGLGTEPATGLGTEGAAGAGTGPAAGAGTGPAAHAGAEPTAAGTLGRLTRGMRDPRTWTAAVRQVTGRGA